VVLSEFENRWWDSVVRGLPGRVGPGTIQAAYYALTGAWPLVAYRSFEAVTGRKREPWLVKTVGLLTVAIAAALSADPHGRTAPGRRLAIGSALAYGIVDVYYAAVRRRISLVYVADAAVEAGLIGAWVIGAARRPAAPRAP
jgi:hypothetical protein